MASKEGKFVVSDINHENLLKFRKYPATHGAVNYFLEAGSSLLLFGIETKSNYWALPLNLPEICRVIRKKK